MHMNLRRPPGAAPAAASRLPASAADDITARRRKTPRWSGPVPRAPASRPRDPRARRHPAAAHAPAAGRPRRAPSTPWPAVSARPHLRRRVVPPPPPQGPDDLQEATAWRPGRTRRASQPAGCARLNRLRPAGPKRSPSPMRDPGQAPLAVLCLLPPSFLLGRLGILCLYS